MPTEHIKYEDTLRQGTDKINNAIDQANKAEEDSAEALDTANQALQNSESTQTQLDTIVIEGDSSVEAAQARVDADGNTYTTLKERLDTEHTEVTAQLAETEQHVGVLADKYLNLQNAVDEAEQNGGGNVLLKAKTYEIDVPLILPSNVKLIGQGMDNTTIKASDNFVGSAVVKTKNFDELTGQNKWLVSEGLAVGFGLIDICIDGNNKITKGIQIYGKRYFIDKLLIKNCWNGAFYSEAGAKGGQAEPADMPECIIRHVFTYENKEWGFDFHGPHDGYIDTVYISGNHLENSKGFRVFGETDVSNGQCEIGHVHLYGCHSDGFWINRAVKVDLLISESVRERPVIIQSSTNLISKLETFGSNKNAGETAVHITGSQNIIGALKILDNGSGNGLLLEGNENNINAYIEGNGSNGFGLESRGLGHRIVGTITGFSAEGGKGYKHAPQGNVRDCDINLNLRNCDLAVEATSANSTRNRVFLAGYGHTTLISGQFNPNDLVSGSMADGVGTKRCQNAIISSNSLDLSTTSPQTIDVEHGLLYTPNIAKTNIVLYNIGDTALDVQYFRIQYADSEKIRVGFKLREAITGTGSFIVQCSI